MVVAALLAGCAAPPDAPPVPAGEIISLGEIESDRAGRCFARMAGPTETTVVTELIEVLPAQKDGNGVVISPAIFRNVTRPVTRLVGQGARFETVCPQVYTSGFVATLQRALIVRRAYGGAVNGLYDEATSVAVQQFQRGMGIDSPLLALSVARDLGIIAVPRG